MHLTDGVVSMPTIVGGFTLAAAACAWSAYKIKDEEIPRIAVFTAAFFVASSIHFKVGVSSVHLIFNGLMGVVLGRRAFLAIVVGLFLQTALSVHVGFSVLGVNACIFGIPAMLVWPIYGWLRVKVNDRWHFAIGAFGGALGVLLAAMLFMMVLWEQGDTFQAWAQFIFVLHLPLMIVEGIVTGFTVQFLERVQPVLIKGESA